MANQRDFNDFVDTIIAEAGGEGRKGMVAVASVINNRATVRGQSVGQVVRAPNQFDGYSNPGSGAKKAQQNAKMRAEAERIARDVLAGKIADPTGGADHFYSGAKKPGWASRLAKTVDIGGHKFHQSPQAASKLGNAVRQVANTVGNVADAVTAPVRQVAAGVGNMASALRTAAFPSMSPPPRPSVDVPGMLAYDLASAKRNQIPTSGIDQKVHAAANSVIPGTKTTLYSGMEPKGLGAIGAKNRHPLGFAGDFHFTAPNGQKITDPVALQDIAMSMAAQHNANIGYGQTGYMGPGRMHIDTMPLDKFPGGAQWGNTAKSWANNLDFARATGIGPTPYTNAPTPTARPEPVETLVAAPLGKVERAPLQAAAPRMADAARFAYDTPNPERFGPRTPSATAKTSRLPSTPDAVAAIDYSETPEWARRNPFANAVVKAYEYLSPAAQAATRPNKPSLSPAALGRGSVTAPSFASARMVAPAMDLPSQSFARAPSLTPAALGRGTVTAPSFNSARMMAPATVAPTQRFSQPVEPAPVGSMNNVPRGNLQPPAPNANMSLAAQYASYGAGKVPNPTPALNAMMSPNVGPLTQTGLMPPNTVIPGFVPATPAPVPAPITTPTVPRLMTPVQRINQAFAVAEPPAPPRISAADIYNGQTGTAQASGGNSVSRFDNNPNTYVTNQYGVTTATGPGGNQMAVRGTPGPGIGGPLGTGGIGSMFDAQPDLNGRSKFGNTARQVGAGMAGSAVGGLLGPIGSLLGAALAGELAKPGAGRVGDLLNGVRTMNINGQPMQFARPQSGGAFPNAPSGGFRDPTFSNRSDRSMRDISPRAADAISKGQGGLY